MKKIVLAIDSFKGCLTSNEAEAACAEGIRQAYPHCSIVSVPIADGGEGMLNALRGLGGEEIQVRVQGPLEKKVDARYRLSPDERTAYIEMASASGLTLVPPEKQNPMLTSTYGTATDAPRHRLRMPASGHRAGRKRHQRWGYGDASGIGLSVFRLRRQGVGRARQRLRQS